VLFLKTQAIPPCRDPLRKDRTQYRAIVTPAAIVLWMR